MRLSNLMRLGVLVALLATLTACSSDNGTNPGNGGGGGGGGTREFVSPTLNNGDAYQHTFNAAKTVRYYCRFHGGPGGVGMSGIITVTATGTIETRAVEITGNTLPSLTVAQGSTVRWTNEDNVPHTVESDN
ncbi:MAG: hypothetical protein IT585_01760 [candidate division Zixibacteria bacterium]|nr:hypothetical protein [candidate division Zixibacteria bacterium]